MFELDFKLKEEKERRIKKRREESFYGIIFAGIFSIYFASFLFVSVN